MGLRCVDGVGLVAIPGLRGIGDILDCLRCVNVDAVDCLLCTDGEALADVLCAGGDTLVEALHVDAVLVGNVDDARGCLSELAATAPVFLSLLLGTGCFDVDGLSANDSSGGGAAVSFADELFEGVGVPRCEWIMKCSAVAALLVLNKGTGGMSGVLEAAMSQTQLLTERTRKEIGRAHV